MVLLRSFYATTVFVAAVAAAPASFTPTPTPSVLPTPTPSGVYSILPIAKRCVVDDPTPCQTELAQREVPKKRCLPDDPTSCSPGDF
ncbi:hypothetical protein AWENTII_006297 [Aspergillus wentii]